MARIGCLVGQIGVPRWPKWGALSAQGGALIAQMGCLVGPNGVLAAVSSGGCCVSSALQCLGNTPGTYLWWGLFSCGLVLMEAD